MEYTEVFRRVTISDRDPYNTLLRLRAVFGIRVSTHAVLYVNHKKELSLGFVVCKVELCTCRCADYWLSC